jgi:uncharacterized protein
MKRFLLVMFALCFSLRDAGTAPNEIRVLRYQAVPMRDGVKLFADVYLPRAAGRYPTLVVRTPYGVQRDGVHETMMKFAQRGYAVVMNDTRGRYESEGRWEPFRNEGKDGYDTIEWAARQPWSNGRVATQGGSYLGHVQWAAASLQPPSLVAAARSACRSITAGASFACRTGSCCRSTGTPKIIRRRN